MKAKLNKIALWFTAVVIVLLVISQGMLFIFEAQLNSKSGFFGMIDVLSKYNAFNNIWFAMSSQIVSIALFLVFLVFIIKELFHKDFN